jgi:hypothetical protein
MLAGLPQVQAGKAFALHPQVHVSGKQAASTAVGNQAASTAVGNQAASTAVLKLYQRTFSWRMECCL